MEVLLARCRSEFLRRSLRVTGVWEEPGCRIRTQGRENSMANHSARTYIYVVVTMNVSHIHKRWSIYDPETPSGSANTLLLSHTGVNLETCHTQTSNPGKDMSSR